MLEVRNLSVSYGQHRALDSASVHVDKGEIVVILGANGAGKSTLLRAISGICEGRVSGEIVMDGVDISGQAPNRIVEQGIALVPENRGVFPDLTVQENLTLGAYSDRARDQETGTLEQVFTLFPKLRERRRQVVRTMSGGEQQMVAIGRAMMSNPAILMLDEPSLGLSPLLCRELFGSLKAVRDTGLGILLVEQNAKQSLAIADRGYLLENAHIVHEDKASALMTDPAVQKAYLGAGGAMAPATHRGPERRAGAKTNQVPASPPPAPAPRPAVGPSPTDIAAAAMQSFSGRRPDAQTPGAPQPQQPRQAAPAVSAPPAPAPRPAAPTPPAPRQTAEAPGGIRIDDLVARASAQSASRVSPRTDRPRPAAPRQAAAAAPTMQTLAMPSLGDSGDRLRAALKEIEEAAARARAYRPPKP